MNWKNLFISEFKMIFNDKALLLTVFGGVLFYSFLYPLPYKNQLPRDQKIVVVDLDKSHISRKFIRMVDATPEIRVSRYANSIVEAQFAIIEEDEVGMVVIPEHFTRDIFLYKNPTLAYAGDASFFLIYSKVIQGLVAAGITLAAEVKIVRKLTTGQAFATAKKQHTAVSLTLRPVFNPAKGYMNYVVPAVFILILHQTLLVGIGLLGGTQNEINLAGKPGYWLKVPSWKLIIVRVLIFLLIYLILALYYFGFCFEFYGISRLAKPLTLILLTIPFILATSFFGICISQYLPRRELATMLVLLSSLPIVFLAGFVWPSNMLPKPLLYFSQLIPAIPGIKAFLQLNQMGAEFHQIKNLWLQLWIQVVIYGMLAMWIINKKQKVFFLNKVENANKKGINFRLIS
jgi:ABC-2 type transport system permease protein